MSRILKLASGLLLVLTVGVSASDSAFAGPGGTGGQGSGGRRDDVITATVVKATSGPAGSGGSSECSWRMVDGDVGIPNLGVATWPRVAGGVTYHLWEKTCNGVRVGWYDVAQRSPRDLLPSLLEQLRERSLPAPTPVFELLDKDFGWAYVRTPLDFRAGDSWRPVSVTASLGPVWATVTASPHRLTFDPGDPAGPGPISCDGDGPLAPYVPEVPGVCSYTYLNASSTSPFDAYHFQSRLTIDWSIAWTSSTGEGGVLEPYSTSADARLAVAEVKALVTCTGPRPEQGSC